MLLSSCSKEILSPVEISVGHCRIEAMLRRCISVAQARHTEVYTYECVGVCICVCFCTEWEVNPLRGGNRFLFALGQRQQVERMIVNF